MAGSTPPTTPPSYLRFVVPVVSLLLFSVWFLEKPDWEPIVGIVVSFVNVVELITRGKYQALDRILSFFLIGLVIGVGAVVGARLTRTIEERQATSVAVDQRQTASVATASSPAPATTDIATTAPAPTQAEIATPTTTSPSTSEIKETPKPVTEVPPTGSIYRPRFLFNRPGPYQSRNGLEPLIEAVDIADGQVSYNFQYDLPQDEADQYSGFVFISDTPVDISAYKYVRVVIRYNDPDAKCEVLLRDFSDNLRYIRLDESSAHQGTKVEINGTTHTILIPVQSFVPVDPTIIMQVGFHTHTNFVKGKHSVVIEDVGFVNE